MAKALIGRYLSRKAGVRAKLPEAAACTTMFINSRSASSAFLAQVVGLRAVLWRLSLKISCRQQSLGPLLGNQQDAPKALEPAYREIYVVAGAGSEPATFGI